MRKLTALAFGLLWLPVALCAQAKTDSVQIKVRTLTIVGAAQISPAERQQIASEIENMPFTLTSVKEISERVRYALQERGFFKVFVAEPDVTIVSTSPSEQIIDATYPVDLGQQYRLKEISFSVYPEKALAFSTSELRQSFPIKDEEIFDTEKIRTGLEKLRELYANSGYINFTPVPNTYPDDQMGTISLRVDMDEGVQFRVGALMLDGVEPAPGVGAKLLQAWKPYEGQIYNQQILDNFMRENAAYFPRDTSTLLFGMLQDPQHDVVNFRLDLDGLAKAQ